MKLSGYRSEEIQGRLWDLPLGNHGHARTIIGNLAEGLTMRLVGGRRHKTTSSASYCPDVSANDVYFESKAVGLSKTAFVYAGRLEKDRDFVSSGKKLYYVIWCHGTATKEAKTVNELISLVLSHTHSVMIIPFSDVDRICSNLVIEKLNNAYGQTKEYPKTYGSGYRIHLSLLKDFIFDQFFNGIKPTDIQNRFSEIVL